MKRLLCVWLPNWPIQRLQSLAAASAPKGSDMSAGDDFRPARPPTILWWDDPRRGRLVVARCRLAAERGVRVGMSIAQAGEMMRGGDRNPLIEPHDPWGDQESLGQLANQFQQHISPLVAIETLDDDPWAGQPRHQSESLLCDITGITHLFGGEEGLRRAADKLLTDEGFVCRSAVAGSIGAAWAIAHYAPAVAVAFPGDPAYSIGSLPVKSLRISQSTASTLGRLGIETVGQLQTLPKDGLATRLGKALVRRLEQATGEIDEPLEVYRPLAEHTYLSELEYPTSDQEILARRMGLLVEKVKAGLATENRGVLRLKCGLKLAAHPPLNLQVGLFAPTLDVDHLTGLLVNQAQGKRLPSAVVRLTLSVTLTGPLRSCQNSLFDKEATDQDTLADADQMSGTTISRLVDSLSGRLGRDAVVGVTLADDPLPENAYAESPLTGNRLSVKPKSRRNARTSKRSSSAVSRSPRSSQARFTPAPSDALRRPLSLLVRPVPLTPDDGTSLDEYRLPDRFRFDGRVHRIVRSWGPERIETGWWKGPSVRRDYYRIETDRGLWWWIFRNLVSETHPADSPQDRWMLHGRFT